MPMRPVSRVVGRGRCCSARLALLRRVGSFVIWNGAFFPPTQLGNHGAGQRGWADTCENLGKLTLVVFRELTMKLVTRERPKIDRIACPWLIQRFIDKNAEFLYVPKGDVLKAAKETNAIPYDVPGVELTHDGDLCSFDAFLKKYKLADPALQQLALIVRGADTDEHQLSPICSGLLAITLGLSHNFTDDHEMLKHGMVLYDALYSWCKDHVG